MAGKNRIVLTDDNWADHHSLDYPESLADGLAVGEDDIDRDGPVVTRLLAWRARGRPVARRLVRDEPT